MRLFPLALLVVSSLWVASEIGLAVFRRDRSGGATRDAGTLRLLNLVIYVSVALGLVLRGARVGTVPLPAAVLWGGLALILAGLLLRWWAIASLGALFTVDVVIRRDHELVTAGPYRRLRHPAYAGTLLSFLGLAVCTSSWVSALVIVVPITWVFLRRVRIEENALREAFPEAYVAYAARTRRLVPGVF